MGNGEASNITNQQDNANDSAQQDVDEIDDIDPTLTNADGEKDDETEDRIQILDLHSANPIISFQNQIYSCEWTSTIGTDVLLTAPDPEFPHPILKEAPGVSILAATAIKLFGRPAQISSRPDASVNDEFISPPTPAPASLAQAIEAPVPDHPTPVKIPVGLATSKVRESQAKFLERLIAIKAAKGEKDDVTVYAQKVNQGSGWRSQQKAADELANEDIENVEADPDIIIEASDSTATTPTVRRASTRGRGGGRLRRGNWRRTGTRTQKGGLFRDYRPQLWDSEGADIRASGSTPDSWDQLTQPSPASTSAAGRIITPTLGYLPPASSPRSDPNALHSVNPDPASLPTRSSEGRNGECRDAASAHEDSERNGSAGGETARGRAHGGRGGDENVDVEMEDG